MLIYPMGHSNVDVEETIKLLEESGIEMVLELRSSPYSRFLPQLNREIFARSLWEAGIEYRLTGTSWEAG